MSKWKKVQFYKWVKYKILAQDIKWILYVHDPYRRLILLFCDWVILKHNLFCKTAITILSRNIKYLSITLHDGSLKHISGNRKIVYKNIVL